MSRWRSGDPWLKHPTWRAAAAHWKRILQRSGLDCAKCHRPIDPGPLRGPWSLDVGHIVSRAQARAMGWTVQQTNALTNTQPEHQRCSRSTGAIDGNQAKGRLRHRPRRDVAPDPMPRPLTRW